MSPAFFGPGLLLAVQPLVRPVELVFQVLDAGPHLLYERVVRSRLIVRLVAVMSHLVGVQSDVNGPVGPGLLVEGALGTAGISRPRGRCPAGGRPPARVRAAACGFGRPLDRRPGGMRRAYGQHSGPPSAARESRATYAGCSTPRRARAGRETAVSLACNATVPPHARASRIPELTGTVRFPV